MTERSKRARRAEVLVGRVYDAFAGDGYRVLVDRLWPRGVSKDSLRLGEWAKDVAPSTELRRWYGHDPARFDAFARRYREELHQAPAAEVLERLRAIAEQQTVVLLTATRDVERSGAKVLQDHLQRLLGDEVSDV